jgi:hypothetical protein
MASEKRSIKFVICINASEAEDLEARKLYQVLPDQDADKVGYLRIIDESGEDYLYPAKWFMPVPLPEDVKEVLLAQS